MTSSKHIIWYKPVTTTHRELALTNNTIISSTDMIPSTFTQSEYWPLHSYVLTILWDHNNTSHVMVGTNVCHDKFKAKLVYMKKIKIKIWLAWRG